MLNSTSASHFVLAAYVDVGLWKYLVFMLLLLFYIAILISNLLLIFVICCSHSLHKPMFLFLCGLFTNEVYGSTSIFPLLLSQILLQSHMVSRAACFLQIYCLYSYAGVEFNTLALMSYDRFLAICHPLQYSSRMLPVKVLALIALTWCYSLLVNLIIIYGLTAQLELCGNVLDKVYCDNYLVTKLSCSDTTANNIFGLVNVVFRLMFLIALILYSYIRIMKVCLSSSKCTRQRALSTCAPHLVSLLNFFCGVLFEITQSRFDISSIPPPLRLFLALYWLSVQPLVSPLVYGLKMTKIRLVVWKLLHRN